MILLMVNGEELTAEIVDSSSAEIRLKDHFYVQEDLCIKGRERRFFAAVSKT